MIDTVNPTLTGDEIHVIGFGTESSLDGTLLTQLAQQHNGLYTRAGDPLNLKKFFALAFGNIFQSGTLSDPNYFLSAGQNQATPLKFAVCGEEIITVVVGWDKTTFPLYIQLETPNGNIISSGLPGVETSTGNTWTFMRIELPYNGQQDGNWQVIVNRTQGANEFIAQQTNLNYFVNVIVKGGPELRLLERGKKYFTGDSINPMVSLATRDGDPAHAAKLKVIITKPNESAGNILSRSRLRQPATINSDTLSARQSTLMELEREAGKPVIDYNEESFELFDDPVSSGGYLESHGIYGRIFKDLLTKEGNYTFHILATYGEDCSATKELFWTIHVDTGIDSSKTEIKTSITSTNASGRKNIKFTITPKDKFGNNIGPGRADVIIVTGISGTTTNGFVADNGDGSYTVTGIWDHSSGYSPGISIAQPGRPPTVIADQTRKPGQPWKIWFWILLVLFILLIIYLLLK
jgi:hypothetical protein